MSGVSDALNKASRLVAPTRRETRHLERISELLLRKAGMAASQFPEVKDVVLGGSFAKGTWIPGHVDLDIFVRIDAGTPVERFEEVGLGVGRYVTKGYPRGKKFAQHPYTEARVEGVRVNIVPCFAVRAKEWKSAADRSPYHVEVVSRLPEKQKGEIKILKLFMKGVGVYGAEIEVQGFSGYAAEVLVMQHGDFPSVLRHFAGTGRLKGPRIFSLPDPVDSGRDLAIAVSGEKYGRMVLASREFLKAPGMSYFRDLKGRSRSSMKEHVVAVSFQHARLSEDVLWGELRRTLRHVVRHLEVRGFRIARSICASDNSGSSAFLFVPEIASLPTLEQRVGPPVDRGKDVSAFLASNKQDARLVWLDDDARVRLMRDREYTDLKTLLSDIVKGKTGPTGGSEEVSAGLRKSARVLDGTGLSKAARSSKWLDRGIGEIVSDVLGTS
ncbi:MAG: CCA tRNA nucleotidyltransferase [Thaumarchaeota archaeon]|nr:CCA tRNA nucleotidyltransferase [Nitrososphaerota archaeon]